MRESKHSLIDLAEGVFLQYLESGLYDSCRSVCLLGVLFNFNHIKKIYLGHLDKLFVVLFDIYYI